jgi:hypothetical protein
MRFSLCIGIVCSLVSIHATNGFAQQSEAIPIEQTVDFNRDIRPILSDHCFNCHGPDANTLQAGLRLDQEDSVFAAAESGQMPVVRGDVGASELIKRIASSDPNDVMPPPDFDKPISPAQADLLRRWIEQGAKWSGHWAFEPVRVPTVPTDNLAEGVVHNPIDAFVLAKLKSEGLTQSPIESRERLIRRVSLDLTGLPPSVREVEDFLADTSPNAFETVVDRLLASQHFGERLAIPWLDLARYGDTSGYHNDSLRDMWLWRQWVIESFNANMPFDQFTIEQLAGDMIADATIQQQIASGFHRNLMTSDEGGLIDAEYRNLYVVDRVATTGVTWLGMTVACAQCHDHKYDPISTEDFYRFYAFFNNVPETGKDGVRDRNPKPFLRVPTPEMEQRQKELEQQLSEAETELASFKSSLPAKQIEWEKNLLAAEKLPQPPTPMAHFPLDSGGEAIASEQDSPESKIVAQAHGEVKFTDGMSGKSFDTTQETWFEYGERFGFEKDQPFSVGAFLYVTPKGGAPFGKMDDGNGARGWDVEFHGLRPSVHLIHKWPEDVIHIQADSDLPANAFTHLAFTYDGSGKAEGLKLYINGQLAKTSIKKDGLKGTIRNEIPFCIGRRGAAGTQFTGRIDDLKIYDRALDAPEIASLGDGDTYQLVAIAPETRTDEQKKRLEDFFRNTQSSELTALETKVTSTRKSKDDFILSIPNTMVMQEMEKPRDTFIKVRGQYDADGDKVLPGTPGFLPPIAKREDDKQLNRLDLANWLVSRDHPLTSRVTINRWWAVLFGNGIVKTLNDFGSQGEQPTHPELLDWLAADFVRDWDTKRVIKQIVMSATYQQTSRASAELIARDQENRLLARGPRQRLDAELIRDNALAIAGVLNPKIGGKSIKPAQPEGTWEINEMSGYKYEKSQGDELYRRGLYVYWRRSTVYPSFVTLDAPTREFCVSQRAKTSTPLQSLVLMNDPVFVEAARAFAQRILTASDLDDAGRIRLAWQTALARVPTEREFAILEGVLKKQQSTYQADAESAAKLIAVGDIARIDKVTDSELAAWTAFCNVVLNLNETISN